jgi:hypothetical protein
LKLRVVNPLEAILWWANDILFYSAIDDEILWVLLNFDILHADDDSPLPYYDLVVDFKVFILLYSDLISLKLFCDPKTTL